MSEKGFVERHQAEWRELDTLLTGLQFQGGAVGGSLARALASGRAQADGSGFPSRYRRICQQLALARYRGYGAAVIEELNRLALRGHQQLYRRPPRLWNRLVHYLVEEVPRTVRREWKAVALAHGLFYGLGLGVYLLIQARPDLVYSFMDPAMVASLEDMYRVNDGAVPVQRESASDLVMFGFYIRNNVSIAFRTFAGGLLLGLGSLFFLGVNGLLLGAAFGHIQQAGLGESFYPFVIGHSAFELTAIVLSAAAGLRLGLAALNPGPRRRPQAIRETASALAPILYGFSAMLLLAAFIEAYWSSLAMEAVWVKLLVGIVLWVVVYTWLLSGGRQPTPTAVDKPHAP